MGYFKFIFSHHGFTSFTSLDLQKETKCKPNFVCVWGGRGGGGCVGGCLEISLVLHHFQLLHFDPQKFGLKLNG